jgi:hypothetical protein
MTPEPITTDQVTETSIHHFRTNASDLGWPPGFWPKVVPTTLGNQQPLVRDRITPHSMTYFQTAGCIQVEVFNS